MNAKRLCAAAMLSTLLPATAWAAMPPTGVYACYEARYAQGAPGCVQTSIGCFGMQIIIAPVMYFGLVDGQSYLDYNGNGGHYAYNSGNGIITMTDGSLHGVRYHKVADWSFRKVDDQGKDTAFTCPLDPKKNVRQRPW